MLRTDILGGGEWRKRAAVTNCRREGEGDRWWWPVGGEWGRRRRGERREERVNYFFIIKRGARIFRNN